MLMIEFFDEVLLVFLFNVGCNVRMLRILFFWYLNVVD